MARVAANYERRDGSGRIRDVSFVGCDIDDYLIDLLGPRFEGYRRRWKAAELGHSLPEFPLFLQVETVDGCNLKCQMCFRRLQNKRPRRKMGRDMFARIMEEVRLGACPSMCLNGNNEPLLDPLIPERIEMAHSAGVLDTRINTNGMLLSEGLSERLIESGLTRLSVSIDAATPETYARIRTGGNFDRVVNNVRGFLKIRRRAGSRLPVLRVTFVVLKDNLDEIEEFSRFWSDKADYVSFQRYVPHTPNDRSLNPQAEGAMPPQLNRCSQPFERLIVDADGNVFPCCSPLGAGLRLGSLQDTTLLDLWSSEREKKLRQSLKTGNLVDEPVCADCLGWNPGQP